MHENLSMNQNEKNFNLTVELPADVKLGDSEKNIIASKDRGGHGV